VARRNLGIVVRRAALEDADELARLRWDFSPDEAAAWGGELDAFREQFARFAERAFTGGSWAVWIAEDGGRLVGNLWVQRVDKVPRPGRFGQGWGYVTNVYVEEAVRDRGVGSRLLAAAVAWARREQLELLLVWPSERSIPFYRRAGFAPSPEALELPLEE
jgi:GNAT superfamily N-acetyltransferase